LGHSVLKSVDVHHSRRGAALKLRKKRRSVKEFMMASAMPVNVLNHGDVNMDPVTFVYAFMQSQSDPF